MDEFELINKYFKRASSRKDVNLSVGDDAALVSIPTDQQLAITTDTLNAGIHFPLETSAYDIAYKSLAVNLSDLAAMGATPAFVTLSLSLPIADETWLQEFSDGFFHLANQFQVDLIGGDMTRGPLSITVQAMGLVPQNMAITRAGARKGDLVYVTYHLGDAGFALQSEFHNEELLLKLNRPLPRVAEGIALRGIATSAVDLSDGLASDLKHILIASNVGAEITVDKIPVSTTLQEKLPLEKRIQLALTAGDDYELCFTVPKDKIHLLTKINCTCIGEITESTTLIFKYSNGQSYAGIKEGYKHF